MSYSILKKARQKIRSLRKVVPPALIVPGMLLIGFFILFTLFGLLIKGLIVIGALLFFRKHLARMTGLTTQKRKGVKKKGVRGKKPQQKQPGRDIL